MASKEESLTDKKTFLKRLIHVGWKHRKDFHSNYQVMGTTIGPKKTIVLNGNEDYPFEKLKSLILTEYVDDNNKYYFDQSLITIGKFNETPIMEYRNKAGEKCGFWEFSKDKLRNKGHSLNLYLLTTMIASVGSKKKMTTGTSLSDIENCQGLSNKPSTTNLNQTNGIINTLSRNTEATYPPYCKLTGPLPFSNDKMKSDSEKYLYQQVHSPVFDQKSGFHEPSINVDLTSPSYSEKTELEASLKNKTKPHSQNPFNQQAHSCNWDQISVMKTSTSKVELSSPKYSKLTGLLPSSNKTKPDFQFVKPYEEPLKDTKVNYLNLSVQIVKENDITFGEVQLGKGAQGVVTKGKYLGSNVAIKSMLKRKNDKMILREIKLLDKVRHPNIISIMAVCPTITQFHIVMEYFNSNSLHDILFLPEIKQKYVLNIKNKNRIAYQVSCATTFLHVQPSPIIHRDIKPGNILVDERFETKLCDLGLGKCIDMDTSLQSTGHGGICGTYMFMAPEIILHRKEATVFSDVWAFACTLIELYNESRVWKIDCFSNLYYSLMKILQKRQVPKMEKIPLNLMSKVQQWFHYNDKARPQMSELLHLFEKICD